MFQAFFHFYDTVYVPDHAAPLNRWVHFLSNLAALACCISGVILGFLPLFLLGVWFQLGPPYLGHILFEKTHRSIDQNPIWAAVGSWYTTSQILLAKQSVTRGPVPWVPPEVEPGVPERRRALRRLLDRYGRNLHGFMALEDGLEVWLDPDGDAGVAYLPVPGHWVAAGAPLCSEADRTRVATAFADAAQAQGVRALFFGVGPGWTGTRAPRFDVFAIGRTPVWAPAAWADSVGSSRKLRNRLRRAEREGLVVRAARARDLQPGGALHADLVDTVTAWVGQRDLPPLGFMTRLDLHHDPDARLTLVAEGPDGVQGFAFWVPVPGRRGWLLEDLVVPRGATPGTAEALVDRGMRALHAAGAELATLGMVVCADVPDDPDHRWLRAGMTRLAHLGRRAYPAEGLLRFRRKLCPHGWEAVYIAADGRVGPAALLAVLRAFTGGLTVFSLHALERFVARRTAPIAVRLRPCELRRTAHALWCRWICPHLPARWRHA